MGNEGIMDGVVAAQCTPTIRRCHIKISVDKELHVIGTIINDIYWCSGINLYTHREEYITMTLTLSYNLGRPV